MKTSGGVNIYTCSVFILRHYCKDDKPGLLVEHSPENEPGKIARDTGSLRCLCEAKSCDSLTVETTRWRDWGPPGRPSTVSQTRSPITLHSCKRSWITTSQKWCPRSSWTPQNRSDTYPILAFITRRNRAKTRNKRWQIYQKTASHRLHRSPASV